jgi:hypothetical protein
MVVNFEDTSDSIEKSDVITQQTLGGKETYFFHGGTFHPVDWDFNFARPRRKSFHLGPNGIANTKCVLQDIKRQFNA